MVILFIMYLNRSYQLVLHEDPVHHSPIRGNRVEVILLGGVWVPADLPDRVSVLESPHTALVNCLLVLVSDVVDQNCSVIEPLCKGK